MGIIEATRNLGVEIQKDERFIRFIKAKLANDNDETLQNQIGEFNTVRMNLDREMNAETQDEEKIREISERYTYQVNLNKRKEDVARLIETQGKLTDEIKKQLEACVKLSQVEDIYRPYQQKRKTRASVAIQKGLKPFSELFTKRKYQRIFVQK